MAARYSRAGAPLPGRHCCRNVGAGEVIPLEQQRLGGDSGKRVSEAVPKVQGRRMPALTETPPGLTCGLKMFPRDGLRLDAGSLQKCVELMARLRSAPALDYDGYFQKVRYRRDLEKSG